MNLDPKQIDELIRRLNLYSYEYNLDADIGRVHDILNDLLELLKKGNLND